MQPRMRLLRSRRGLQECPFQLNIPQGIDASQKSNCTTGSFSTKCSCPLGSQICPAYLSRLVYVFIQEPTKAELLAYEADKSAVPARTAYCIVQAFPKSPVNEVEVELSGDSANVRSWKQVHASTEHPDAILELHAHFVNMRTGHITLPYRASSANFALNRKAQFALNRKANIISLEPWYSHAV